MAKHLPTHPDDVARKKGIGRQKLGQARSVYCHVDFRNPNRTCFSFRQAKKLGEFFPQDKKKQLGPNFARCWAIVRMPSCSLADWGKRLENPWNEEAEDAWRTWSHEACDGVNGSMLAVIL